MPESENVPVAMIVAMAKNRVIGCDNRLPWHLPNDLKYFKATTMNKPVVMGRKTFKSIGKPLPGRTNIVVTNNRSFHAEGVKIEYNLADAIATGRQIATVDGASEVMVIGGAMLYASALSKANRIYITQVLADISGDAYFPELDWTKWVETSCEEFIADERNPYDYRFAVYDRS